MVHDLGIAMACLGLSLLITRSRLARRALGPLAAAGAMTLTLYTAHVIVLEATSFLEDHPIQLFLVLVYIALSFAALWRQGGRRGPLEAAVTWASARSRHLVESHSRTNRKKQPQATPPPEKATATASAARRRNNPADAGLGRHFVCPATAEQDQCVCGEPHQVRRGLDSLDVCEHIDSWAAVGGPDVATHGELVPGSLPINARRRPASSASNVSCFDVFSELWT
jgi:hypothetical protein